MSEYLDRVKRFTSDKRLVYASPHFKDAINRMEEFETCLSEIVTIANNCDGWESFPSEILEKAEELLK